MGMLSRLAPARFHWPALLPPIISQDLVLGRDYYAVRGETWRHFLTWYGGPSLARESPDIYSTPVKLSELNLGRRVFPADLERTDAEDSSSAPRRSRRLAREGDDDEVLVLDDVP
jgi:hypothetical protein